MSAAKKIIDEIKGDLGNDLIETHSSYLKLVELFPLQTLSTKRQHLVALKIIERIMGYMAERRSPRDLGIEMYLNTLAELAEDYEIKSYSNIKVSGVEMLEYLMELKGLAQKDIAQDLGGQSIVSNILSGKRELNIKQVRALAKRFKVPPSVFV